MQEKVTLRMEYLRNVGNYENVRLSIEREIMTDNYKQTVEQLGEEIRETIFNQMDDIELILDRREENEDDEPDEITLD